MMRASVLLGQAAVLVEGDRARQHGPARETLGLIADFWGSYLGVPVQASDVALMLALVKIARARTGAPDADHFRDLAGYAGLAAELAVDAVAP